MITHPADASLGDPLFASRKEGFLKIAFFNLLTMRDTAVKEI
ncbi:MAG: hypothetical protein ACXVAY_05585 [Mucilaginibacter sp.]